MTFFAHLLILEYPDHHQNLISSSLYYPRPLHKILSQSIYKFLSNVVQRQTDKLTNQRYQKHNILCQGGNNRNKDHLDSQTNWRDGETRGQTNRYTGTQGRWVDGQTDGWMDRQTDGWTDKQTGHKMDSQTGQTDNR